MHLTPTGAPLQLAVFFPSALTEPKLVAMPTCLPMGWTESLPAFSAVTETIADLINSQLEVDDIMPPQPHPMESLASRPVPIVPSAPDQNPMLMLEAGPLLCRPLAYADIYADGFLKLCQGCLAQ